MLYYFWQFFVFTIFILYVVFLYQRFSTFVRLFYSPFASFVNFFLWIVKLVCIYLYSNSFNAHHYHHFTDILEKDKHIYALSHIKATYDPGTYIRWYLRNCCARKEQYLLIYLAFDYKDKQIDRRSYH